MMQTVTDVRWAPERRSAESTGAGSAFRGSHVVLAASSRNPILTVTCQSAT